MIKQVTSSWSLFIQVLTDILSDQIFRSTLHHGPIRQIKHVIFISFEFLNPRVFWLRNSRVCNRVVISVDTNISKEQAVSIFRTEVNKARIQLGYTME